MYLFLDLLASFLGRNTKPVGHHLPAQCLPFLLIAYISTAASHSLVQKKRVAYSHIKCVSPVPSIALCFFLSFFAIPCAKLQCSACKFSLPNLLFVVFSVWAECTLSRVSCFIHVLLPNKVALSKLQPELTVEGTA